MSFQVCIPLPLQIVIDDVGWRQSRDGHEQNEPYRTGMHRLHGAEDYRAIAHLGRRLNMRPQAVMVMSEWDVDNRLRTIPTASWMGEAWDNRANVGEWMEESARVIRENDSFLELTLHGLGHEYWSGGPFTRAEWHDSQGNMRPVDEVVRRLDLFAELVERHRLGLQPTSFVPCAFAHHFGHPTRNLARILAGRGVRWVSTPFRQMARSVTPEHEIFGFDHGVLTVDRGRDHFNWYVSDPHPERLPDEAVLGMHWPHVLHPDPARNEEVVERWVALLGPMKSSFDRLLSRDTASFCAQLVHHFRTSVSRDSERITVDARGFYSLPWAELPTSPVILKLRGSHGLTVRDEAGGLIPAVRHFAGGQTIHEIAVPVSPARQVVTLRVSETDG